VTFTSLLAVKTQHISKPLSEGTPPPEFIHLFLAAWKENSIWLQPFEEALKKNKQGGTQHCE